MKDLKIEIYYQSHRDNIDLTKMNAFSEFFTKNKIIPNESERIFVPDNNNNFIDEKKFSGSCEWRVHLKIYDPEYNKIRIWCCDTNEYDELNEYHKSN